MFDWKLPIWGTALQAWVMKFVKGIFTVETSVDGTGKNIVKLVR